MAEFANEAGLQLPTLIHADDTIFEFVVNDKGQWEHWMDRVSIDLISLKELSQYSIKKSSI